MPQLAPFQNIFEKAEPFHLLEMSGRGQEFSKGPLGHKYRFSILQ